MSQLSSILFTRSLVSWFWLVLWYLESLGCLVNFISRSVASDAPYILISILSKSLVGRFLFQSHYRYITQVFSFPSSSFSYTTMFCFSVTLMFSFCINVSKAAEIAWWCLVFHFLWASYHPSCLHDLSSLDSGLWHLESLRCCGYLCCKFYPVERCQWWCSFSFLLFLGIWDER